MRLRAEARVGLIVFLALVGLIIIYAFFGQSWIGRGNYNVCAVFDDVLRLSRGADVRMAGVRIGSVQDIELTPKKQAKVILGISRKYENAIREDSTVRITTGGLIGVGEYYIEILPGSSNIPLKGGACLKSVKMPNLDDVMGQVTGIVGDLKTSISSINKILQDKKTKQTLDQILENIKKTSETSVLIAEQMKGTVTTSQPKLQAALQNVVNASDDFAGSMKYIRQAVERSDLNAIKKTLDSIATTAKNLEDATASLKKLAQDPQIACDIKQTTAAARQAAQGAVCIVDQVQKLTTGLNGKLNKIGGVLNPGPPAGYVPDIGSRFDMLYQSGDPNFRFDYNYTMPWDYDQFFRLGVTNVGEGTGVNLQAGTSLGDKSAIRYGLISSKIGVGYDRLLSNKLALETNFYDPNDPTVSALLKYDVSRQIRAELGFNNGDALVGVQYKK